MSTDKAAEPVEVRPDGMPVSYSELVIEREKVQIERERLALERERLMAERERWTSEDHLRPGAEGRGISVSTLVFVGVIGILAGALVGLFTHPPQNAGNAAAKLESLLSVHAVTNASGKGESPIVLRAVDAGSGHNAYLLILN